MWKSLLCAVLVVSVAVNGRAVKDPDHYDLEGAPYIKSIKNFHVTPDRVLNSNDVAWVKSLPGYKAISHHHRAASSSSHVTVDMKGDDEEKFVQSKDYIKFLDDTIKDLKKSFEDYDPNSKDAKKNDKIDSTLSKLEDLFTYATNGSLTSDAVTDEGQRGKITDSLHTMFNDARDLLDAVVGKKDKFEVTYEGELSTRFEWLVDAGGEVREWFEYILGEGANARASIDFWVGVLETLGDIGDVLGAVDDNDGDQGKNGGGKQELRRRVMVRGRGVDASVHVG